MTWTLEGRPLRRVLVSRLRYLGDIVMSTVVMDILKEGDPDLEIGFLGEEPHTVILENHPGLSQLHRLRSARSGADARARVKITDVTETGAVGSWAMQRQLRNRRYDLAVDLFFNPRSAWLLRLAGIPLRIGGTRGSRRWLYTHAGFPGDAGDREPSFRALAPGALGDHLSRLFPLRHHSSGASFLEWFLETRANRPVIPQLPSPAVGPGLEKILSARGWAPGRPFVVAVPGATWPSKEWPLDQWRQLIPHLAELALGPVVMVAPPGAHQRWSDLEPLLEDAGGGLLPVLPLRQVAELLSRAALTITVDGGVMHLSVGLMTPTVALFGPTRPEIWFPYEHGGPFRVVGTWPHCHPCHLHQCGAFICLPELSPTTVLAAARQVLAMDSGGNPGPFGGV